MNASSVEGKRTLSLETHRLRALKKLKVHPSDARRRGEALAQVEGPKVRSGVSARPARPLEAPAAGALVPRGRRGASAPAAAAPAGREAPFRRPTRRGGFGSGTSSRLEHGGPHHASQHRVAALAARADIRHPLVPCRVVPGATGRPLRRCARTRFAIREPAQPSSVQSPRLGIHVRDTASGSVLSAFNARLFK